MPDKLDKGPTGRVRALRRLLSGVSREDVIEVLADFSLADASRYGFAESTDFDLIYGGVPYPPKAILGIAAKKCLGRVLRADEFSGGVRSPCFAVLMNLGFDIQPKVNSTDTGLVTAPFERLAEEVSRSDTVIEGAKKTITVNAYERDRGARERCIEYWGLACVVCRFDFESRYGRLGAGFIHVHHLKPLSELKAEYQLDPVADLRPVCPNCHAMLHRPDNTLSIEELRLTLRPKNV
jgi:5-methylcytosine-specific restriction protein A